MSLRANNYQRRDGAAPPVDGQMRMGAHTDYGSITVLLADHVPGLQLRDDAGRWHDVLPPEDGFLVNIGDLLAEWTNDRWRSTMHRVVPPTADVSGSVAPALDRLVPATELGRRHRVPADVLRRRQPGRATAPSRRAITSWPS